MVLTLDSIQVKQITGVSAQKQSELHAFGVFTVKDLLEYYPFRYEDFRPKSLSEVKHGDKATVVAKVIGIPVLQRFGGKSRMSLQDGGRAVDVHCYVVQPALCA